MNDGAARRRWPSSLRARLTLWYTAALGLPLVAFAVLTYYTFARALADRTDRYLADALTVIDREVHAERRLRATAREAIETTVEEVRFRDVRIVVLDSVRRVVATGVESDSGLAGDGDRVLAALGSVTPGEAFTVSGPGGGDRVLTRELQMPRSRFLIGAAATRRGEEAILQRIRDVFLIAIPILVVLAAGGAFLLASRGLAPVSGMVARAGDIRASNLHERLPVGGGSELEQLARVFNALLDRLEESFAQQRRFVADASHELRTPTAALQAEAQVTLSRASRSEAEYRETVATMLQSSKRLSRLVDDLFLLARADTGHFGLREQPVDFDEVVQDAVREMLQVGEHRGVRVTLEHIVPAPMHGDATLLGRVVLNLLDNAIKYSPKGGTVSVSMDSAAGAHRLTVVDEGPGIAADAVERVFDRFYRGDAARAREDGSVSDGAGLGLSIARQIAGAHRGRLEVASSRPGRTEFRLTVPAA